MAFLLMTHWNVYLSALIAVHLNRHFLSWIKSLEINTTSKIISIDGKTVRGSQNNINAVILSIW
jgi:hypothetical protein